MSDFGKTNESYSVSIIIELIKQKQIEELKKYISKYFIKLNNTQQSFM